MYRHFTFILLVVLCTSCGCNKECTSPPVEFTIEVQDAETGSNLLEDGTIVHSGITLKATDNNQPVDFDIVDNKIVSNEIGWLSADGTTEFELTLDEAGVVIITVVYKAVTEDCCSFFELQGASFNKDYEMVNEYNFLIKL